MKPTKTNLDREAKRCGINLDKNAILDVKHTCLIVYNRQHDRYTAVGLGTKIENPGDWNRPDKTFWHKTKQAAVVLALQIFKDRAESARIRAIVDSDGLGTKKNADGRRVTRRRDGGLVVREVLLEGGRAVIYPENVEARQASIYNVKPLKKGVKPSDVKRVLARLNRAWRLKEIAEKKLESMVGSSIHVTWGVHKSDFEEYILGIKDEPAKAVRETVKPHSKKQTRKRRVIRKGKR